ncbi:MULTISPECIES: MFS transporter [Halolamina]|uniref:Predicted arabinose efflux permease, MFS family n=1 Tax=Halolamina pelagica TaxID=699431 RepID=A0A1I5R143_9EURY|nr:MULTISPECIES: MFS transporter [Halolamina]NHX35630.1 MFS transporter [Halolamina sp. R1-12]SFP52067.1 Predicted arabinose efflux permease, MFS family [Halolamina pelagica]
MNEERLQFWSLYLSRFATGFGYSTLALLIPFYIEVLNASDFMGGLFITGFTLAQTIVVIPLAWAGDRYDKKKVLLAVLSVSVVAYVAFANVQPIGDAVAVAAASMFGIELATSFADSTAFIGVRALQGAAVTGSGLMTLSLVGELADHGERANAIGKANSVRFLASILGMIIAGGLYQVVGFTPIYTVIVVSFALGLAGVWLYLPADETRSYGNPFSGLALNKRIITLTSFRAQYAVAVTVVRSWVAIYAGVSAARGGLAYAGLAVAFVLVAEKLTNMLCQPFTGRLSDGYGRSLFVFAGGGAYGLVALAVPFTPAIGTAVGLPGSYELIVPSLLSDLTGVGAGYSLLGKLGPAFVPLLVINGLLGVVDAFREPASMALFADEGADEGGIAASFGIRELVWRPGSVLGPMMAGWLWSRYGIETVFYVGGAFAVTGAITFAVVLTHFHGRGALTEW